jgi:hypothetical protein
MAMEPQNTAMVDTTTAPAPTTRIAADVPAALKN